MLFSKTASKSCEVGGDGWILLYLCHFKDQEFNVGSGTPRPEPSVPNDVRHLRQWERDQDCVHALYAQPAPWPHCVHATGTSNPNSLHQTPNLHFHLFSFISVNFCYFSFISSSTIMNNKWVWIMKMYKNVWKWKFQVSRQGDEFQSSNSVFVIKPILSLWGLNNKMFLH